MLRSMFKYMYTPGYELCTCLGISILDIAALGTVFHRGMIRVCLLTLICVVCAVCVT